MATRAIKAQRRAIAQAALNDLVGRIATQYGIERPAVPLVRDPELKALYDLEADLAVFQAFYEETQTWTQNPTRANPNRPKKGSPPRPSPSRPQTERTPPSPPGPTT